MTRGVARLLAGALLVAGVGVAALAGFTLFRPSMAAQAQPLAQDTGPDWGNGPMSVLPPELDFLRSMTSEQRFDHTLGSQMRFQNPQGQEVVLNVIPGKVTAVGATSITIQPNGSAQMRTFNVTQTTFVRGTAHRGTLTTFAPGDRVIVYTIGSSTNASGIVEASALLRHHGAFGPRPAHPSPGGTATPTPVATPAATP